MSEDLCFTPASDLAARIRRRDLSPVEVVEAFLDRIKARNDWTNAYVTVIEHAAREAARKAERAVGSGAPLGRLHGVPIAIKDLFDFKAGVRNPSGQSPWPASRRRRAPRTSSGWRGRARSSSETPTPPNSGIRG